jgi:DNA-binding protein H-NS
MSNTYTGVMQQIKSLQREADKLRRKEVTGVIARIREAISAYGLTAADLGFGGRPAPVATKAPAKKGRKRNNGAMKTAGLVKYANGSGGTWGGRGKRPQWLRDALGSGKKLEDFLVK